jgi:hypothetical protein
MYIGPYPSIKCVLVGDGAVGKVGDSACCAKVAHVFTA